MSPPRISASAIRTWFSVAVWSFAAFVWVFFSVAKSNIGYLAVGIAVAIVGALATPAPGEKARPRLDDPFGRLLAVAALCLGVIGGLLIWLVR